jgi:YggT family protein
MESIYNAIYTVTEPVLGPVRRTLPAFGGLDFSPIVVILALQLLSSALGGR